MDMSTIPLTPDDVGGTARFDVLRAIAVALFVGVVVFLAIVSLLTLFNTSTTVSEERHTQLQVKGTQDQLKGDVKGVENFGAGIEYQNARICVALGTLCPVAPNGSPPR